MNLYLRLRDLQRAISCRKRLYRTQRRWLEDRRSGRLVVLMGPSLEIDIYSYRLVRKQYKNLVIGGTRWKRLSGHLTFRCLGSHKSLLRERISKHSRLTRREIGRDGRGGLLSSQRCLRIPHLPQLWEKRIIVHVMTIKTTT